jgi:DNA polymerase-3 subunit delta
LLYILFGEDDFSLTRSLEEIKRGIGDQSLLEANTSVLDGQQVTVDHLRGVGGTMPFLAEKRLVIVQGLLGRFEPEGKPRLRKKIAPPNEKGKEAEYKSFADCLEKIPDSTVLVLIDGKVKSSNPLLKQLLPRAKVRSFPILKEDRLRQWIKREVVGQGTSISPEAVDLLAKLVGGNLWIMTNEINKLALFASGRRIEVEDIKALVSLAQETSVFAMVDAILDFKVGVAEQLLEQLLERGASPAYLLVMLARQVRMIVRARELRRQRGAEVAIQDKLGLTSEFALRKTLDQAQRYPMERLREVYSKLLETDLAIKTGKYDGELALNLLIADLCQQGNPAR